MHLPPELRTLVWQLAIHPRIVIYSPYRRRATPPPALLHVCQESRREGLRHYQRVDSPTPVYIDPSRDTLFCGAASDPEDLSRDLDALSYDPAICEIMTRTAHLAFSLEAMDRLAWLPQYADWYEGVRRSCALRRLTIVRYGVDVCGQEVEFVDYEHRWGGVRQHASPEEMRASLHITAREHGWNEPELQFVSAGDDTTSTTGLNDFWDMVGSTE